MKKTAKHKFFEEGVRISVQGYIYEVLRGFGNFYTIQCTGIDESESRPKGHRKRLKKKDSFSIDRNLRITVIAASGASWYRIRVKVLSDEEIRVLEEDLDTSEEKETAEHGTDNSDMESDLESTNDNEG